MNMKLVCCLILFVSATESLRCPGSTILDRLVDVNVVCVDSKASIGKMMTHEARIDVRCETTGFDVSSASEMYSFTDLIEMIMFRDQRHSVEDTARSQAQYSKTSLASSIWTCPTEGLSPDPHLCSVSASPNGKTCVAIDPLNTVNSCNVSCSLRPARWRPIAFAEDRIAIPRFLMFLLGLFLYAAAPSLSESVTFHYSMGITVGFLASFMIVFYVLSRSLSGRWAKAAALVVGLTGNFGLVFRYVVNGMWWRNLSFWRTYWKGVLVYVSCTFVMSLGITHWMLRKRSSSNMESSKDDGVPTSRTLLRILLRMLAIMFAYQSSSTLCISFVACFAVAFGRGVLSFVFDWINWISGRGDYYVPRKPNQCHLTDGRFLTNDEYELRKQITTEKEMRKMCSSPAFQRWIRQNADRIHVLPPKSHED